MQSPLFGPPVERRSREVCAARHSASVRGWTGNDWKWCAPFFPVDARVAGTTPQNGPARTPLPSKDLRGLRLIGEDLSGLDLSAFGLAGADLSRANLAAARLVGAKLQNAVLFEANLADAEMFSADLRSTQAWSRSTSPTPRSSNGAHPQRQSRRRRRGRSALRTSRQPEPLCPERGPSWPHPQ